MPPASARASSRSFISSSMMKVFENIRKITAHAMGGSFLLFSSRPPRLGFSYVVQRDHSRARAEPDGPITQRTPQPHARPSIQQLRRSRSTLLATSVLLVNLASNLGTQGQPRRQPQRSRSTSPTTSALPANLRWQPRRSRSTFASNSRAPGQTSPAALRVRGWALRVFSPLAHLLGSHEQASTYPVAPSDVLYPVIGQFSHLQFWLKS